MREDDSRGLFTFSGLPESPLGGGEGLSSVGMPIEESFLECAILDSRQLGSGVYQTVYC